MYHSLTFCTGTFLMARVASRDVDTAGAFIQGLGSNYTLTVVNEGKNDSANSLTPHVCYFNLS